MAASYSRCRAQSGKTEHAGEAVNASRYKPGIRVASAGGATETSSSPKLPSAVAEIVASPEPADVTSPLLETVTTPTLLEDHSASAVTSRTDPSLMWAVAVNWRTWFSVV